MATNKNPIFLNSVSQDSSQIDNAAGTTPVTVFTAGGDGGAITNIIATTTDTSAVTLVVSVDDGTTTNVIGEILVPAGSGTDGSSVSVNVLDPIKLAGALQADGSLLMGPTASLDIGAKSAVTAATIVSIVTIGGSYSV